MDFFDILTLIGGLALFLYGMELMGDGLKKAAGGKLEAVLAKLTSTRFKGFLLGFIVTAVIQSSSATTVMLVGFVNSGIMKLGQTISIIMGSNIGTTVTAWLLSLTEIGDGAFILKLFKPSSFTPVLAVIGVIMIMAGKTEKRKKIGSIFVGFAVLMTGMDLMSGAMDDLKESESFGNLMIMFDNNPVMGIIMGTLLTAIIQSSSASVGILQALSISVPIHFATAFPIILGQNIGTTITPIIASITGNTNSKRVALSCIYIKMIGVVIVCAIFYAINYFVGFEFMNMEMSPTKIAITHTLFNIATTIILMPFCSWIEKLAIKSVKESKNNREYDIFDTLEERFFDVPSFAVGKSRELVEKMAEITRDSLIKSTTLLTEYDKQLEEEIRAEESEIDKFEDKISTYLVKLSAKELTEKDSHMVSQLLHCIGDLERISDHAVHIVEVARELNDKGIDFSTKAEKDIKVITDAVCEVVSLAVSSLVDNNLETAKKVEPLEQVIDKLKYNVKKGHIERLKEGTCTVELGFALSDLLVNYERVSDHCSNIAVCILEIANDSFETHEYLNNVKENGENSFFEQFDQYSKKYALN
ncbi:MAG: Na/Pi cotransporter family protein [Clostridia bacterium]|nr:Na/Pi cotransporter family protein [Clostridia bacterium]